MTANRIAFPIVTTLALLLLPTAAGAEYVVPSGNSAVNQYTETYPTAGGGRDSEGGSGSTGTSPKHVLGNGKTRRLDAHGADGRAAAVVAADTAPAVPSSESSALPNESSGHGSSTRSSGGSKGAQGHRDVRAAKTAAAARQATVDLPTGSSGLSETLARATGASSSDGTGLLLPLALLGTMAWALGFAWRQRRQVG